MLTWEELMLREEEANLEAERENKKITDEKKQKRESWRRYLADKYGKEPYRSLLNPM